MERCLWSRRHRRQLWFRAARAGQNGPSRGRLGARRRKKCRWNDSKGGKLVYSHTKPGDQNGNPGLWVIEYVPYNAGSISYKEEFGWLISRRGSQRIPPW
jgi:hypothetical protein